MTALATRSIYGHKTEHVNYERTLTLMAQQQTEDLKQNKLTLEIAVMKEESLQGFLLVDEHIATEKSLQNLNEALTAKAVSEHANLITSRADQYKIDAEKLTLLQGQSSSAGAMFSKIKEETTILKAQAAEALKTEAVKQAYYTAQKKAAEATTLKVEAETKILVEHVVKEHSQGHLYNAGTTLACLGCITGLSVLGVQGFKKVQELRG